MQFIEASNKQRTLIVWRLNKYICRNPIKTIVYLFRNHFLTSRWNRVLNPEVTELFESNSSQLCNSQCDAGSTNYDFMVVWMPVYVLEVHQYGRSFILRSPAVLGISILRNNRPQLCHALWRWPSKLLHAVAKLVSVMLWLPESSDLNPVKLGRSFWKRLKRCIHHI